jgi:hypothetical protein
VAARLPIEDVTSHILCPQQQCLRIQCNALIEHIRTDLNLDAASTESVVFDVPTLSKIPRLEPAKEVVSMHALSSLNAWNPPARRPTCSGSCTQHPRKYRCNTINNQIHGTSRIRSLSTSIWAKTAAGLRDEGNIRKD